MKVVKTSLDFSMLEGESHTQIGLLGVWCLNNCENILKVREQYNIAIYHWDDREKYNSDFLYLNQIYENKLTILVPILNKIHSLDKDIRYWRIVIGPWLRFFIDAVFDRYECIRSSQEYNKASSYDLYSYDIYEWCPSDFPEFWDDLTSEEWNEVIFSECIIHQKILVSQVDRYLKRSYKNTNKDVSFRQKCRNLAKWISSKYSELIGPKYRGSVVIGAYSSLRATLKLYLKLRQLPYLSLPVITLPDCEVNKKMRTALAFTRESLGFEAVFEKLLPAMMPKVYLENFSELREKILVRLPEKPKSIFTANLYQADDVFKIWAADMCSAQVPLFIGQHGGTFSIAEHNQTVDHQLKIADKFVSWGWDKQGQDHIIKLPSMQLAYRSYLAPAPRGQVLHLLTSLPRYFYCHYSVPVAGQFLSYIDDQLQFFNRLEPTIRKNLRIRPDPTQAARGWNVKEMISNAGFGKELDESGGEMLKVIGASKLCICTSNSTVFLQTLSMNFPTVVFWDNKYNEISSDAQDYIDLLVASKILFFNPVEAAQHVNTIISTIDDWWFSREVQKNREIFCDRYAFNKSDWIDGWSWLFK